MHAFATVLMEVIVNVTEDAEPVFVKESELVLIEGDSFPVTSTRCPRYCRSFILPVAWSSYVMPGFCLVNM